MKLNRERTVVTQLGVLQLWACGSCGAPMVDGIDDRNTNRTTGVDACDDCYWKD